LRGYEGERGGGRKKRREERREERGVSTREGKRGRERESGVGAGHGMLLLYVPVYPQSSSLLPLRINTSRLLGSAPNSY
jgi:hypothetical protein